jgi:hypothetical protein
VIVLQVPYVCFLSNAVLSKNSLGKSWHFSQNHGYVMGWNDNYGIKQMGFKKMG